MTQEAKLDLCACIDLLESTDDLMFDWDTTIYLNTTLPSTSSRPRKDIIGLLPKDMMYKDYVDPEDDYDDDDLDLVSRPTWCLGEVHVAKKSSHPYWKMIRYVFNYVFLI